jgi:hypothetical protein
MSESLLLDTDVAATALRHDMALVTNNLKHFETGLGGVRWHCVPLHDRKSSKNSDAGSTLVTSR